MTEPVNYMNLINDHIHLWHIDLSATISCTELLAILAKDEQDKANAFYFAKDKNNYIRTRAALRKIISKYYSIEPGKIGFSYGKYNKPYISANPHHLHFNVSHSNNMAIVAIIKHHTIGIDLEYIKPINDLDSIVEKFSMEEKNKFLLLPNEQKLRAFYTIWTRKEAFIKAIGRGLSTSLDTFEVSFLENEPAQILKIKNSTAESKKWVLSCFTFVDHANNEYIIAIATKSNVKNIIKFYY